MIKEPDSQLHRRRLIPIILAFVLACALITETIGIHALFGAFMAGVVMPPSTEFRIFLKDKLEAFGSYALLPLFFAFTGLRTQIGLLNDWQGWLMCARDHSRGDRGQAGRQHVDESLDGHELVAVVLDRRADEHERIS